VTTPEALLERTYAAFNARDVDAVLAMMHAEVDWPNGMEGGRVHGHRAVREYWTRQWSLIDPRVEPRGFTTEADGRVAVDVRQVVRDRAGALLKDEMVRHVYRIEDGLIRSMEIRPGSGA
jgi:ketosteroid isomerase-like protein